MTQTLRVGKRAFTYFVAVTTILWSVGFAAMLPLTASAVDLQDGDLIKRSDMTDTYYYLDGTRHPFPLQNEYMSWYEDFDDVQTLTVEEMNTIGLGASITLRPGTNLAKVTTDPKVYVVTPGGVFHWLKTADVAAELYGANWEDRLVDLLDITFGNYTVGDDIDSSDVYPDGTLVMDGTDYWYIEGGMKRAVDAEALTGNHFVTSFAVEGDLSSYSQGEALTSSEVSDSAETGAVIDTPSTPGAGGDLTISLSSDTPEGDSILVDTTTSYTHGQRFIDMIAVDFKATGAAVTVDTVTGELIGVSKDNDVDEVYLMDGDTILAKTSSISDGDVTWSDSDGIFSLTDGELKTLWVRLDVNKAASSGKTVGVKVTGAELDGGGDVTGSASSDKMTVATVTDLGYLEVATSSPQTATTADADAAEMRELAKFKFDAVDQDMLVKTVVFTQIGSVESTDLRDLMVEVAGEQYNGEFTNLGDDTLEFNFTSHEDGGLKIESGQSKYLDIRGKVAAGTNRTFAFSIQNEEDVRAWDMEYDVYAAIWADNETDFAVQTTANTTVNTGGLTIQVNEDSPNGNIVDAASNVTLAKFDLTASGEDVKVTSLSVYFDDATGRDANMKNVKVLLDGTQVGTTVASTTALDSTALDADFTFSNNFVVEAGETSVLTVVADTNGGDLATGDTLTTYLRAGSNNAQGKSSLSQISSSAVTSYTLTVQGGAPTLTENLTVADGASTNPTGVLNSKSVTIGSFVISAGSGEGSKITSMTLTAGGLNLAGSFLNMRLQHNGEDVAPVKGTLTSGTSDTFDYTLNESISLAKGEAYVVDIVADVLSTTSSDPNLDSNGIIYPSSVTYQTLETGQSGTAPMSAGLQNVFIAESGSLTLALAADNPNEHYVAMGGTDKDVAHFKLTTGKEEPILVSKMVVSFVSAFAQTAITAVVGNVRLMDGDTTIGSAIPSLATSLATGDTSSTAFAVFDNINFTVPKNASKTVKVMADVTAQPDSNSSSTFYAAVLLNYNTDDADGLTARGDESGTSLSSISGLTESGIYANYMHPLKAILSVAHATNAPSGSDGSGRPNQTVAKWVFTNESNVNTQEITIKLLNLKVNTSISAAAGHAARNLYIYKKDTTVNNRVATTDYDDGDYEDTSYGDLGTAADDTLFAEADFTDFTIDSGSDEVVTVTLDTDDASTNNTLTIDLVAEAAAGAQASGSTLSQGIIWSDGYVTSIYDIKPTASGTGSLPLSGKTLTY